FLSGILLESQIEGQDRTIEKHLTGRTDFLMEDALVWNANPVSLQIVIGYWSFFDLIPWSDNRSDKAPQLITFSLHQSELLIKSTEPDSRKSPRAIYPQRTIE